MERRMEAEKSRINWSRTKWKKDVVSFQNNNTAALQDFQSTTGKR